MRNAGKTPLTSGLHKQTLTFAGAVLAQLPRLSEAGQQNYVRNPKRLQKVLAKAFAEDFVQEVENPCELDLARWSDVYLKLFNRRPDLSGIRIPEKPEGVGPVRLIVVAKELLEWTGNKPLEGVQEALKKHFPGWEYDNDLDVAIPTNDRDPKNGSYAVWVKDARGADDDLENFSADDLAEKGIPGITMLERQLLEADYFWQRGEHLDQQNWTLCSGSRDRDGSVPHVNWNDWFRVNWASRSTRNPRLRSRRVWA